jgi:hypothetical protein
MPSKEARSRTISAGVKIVFAFSVRPGISSGRIAAPVARKRWS